MTIAFKELAGSPIETYGPAGMTARRLLLCAWDDRQSVVERLLGDGYRYAGQSRAPYPDKPGVVAIRARCEPLTDDLVLQTFGDLTEGLNRYNGFAKVTVDYELLVPTERPDLPETEPGTFLGYRQDSAGERIRLPAHSLAWQDEPTVPVTSEAAPSVRIPMIVHHVTWHRVVRPPWETIRSGQGTVNSGTFLGAPVGTVLLDGVTADREFLGFDSLDKAELGWRIGYTFRERAVKVAGASSPDWNHAYRSMPADDPAWDELADANGNRPYASSDFTDLFRFEATS